MGKRQYRITNENLARYAELLDIRVDGSEIAALTGELAGGFRQIEDLWDVDLSDVEPASVLPVDGVRQ